MTIRPGLKFIPVACLLLAIPGLPGCSIGYRYDIHLIVRDVRDSTPLGGVNASFEGDILSRAPGITKADGKFSANELFVPDNAFEEKGKTPRIAVSLSKDGFSPEKIEISLDHEPKTDKDVHQIVIVAYMKPIEP